MSKDIIRFLVGRESLCFKFEEDQTWNELRKRRNARNWVSIAGHGIAQCLRVGTLKHGGGWTL